MQNALSSDDRIGINMADRIVFVNIHEIMYCEANGSYTNVWLHDGKKMVDSKPPCDFGQQLMGHKFLRIHHSSLINLNRVKEFQRHDSGYVIMEDGKRLEVSQRKRRDFLNSIYDIVV